MGNDGDGRRGRRFPRGRGITLLQLSSFYPPSYSSPYRLLYSGMVCLPIIGPTSFSATLDNLTYVAYCY